MSEELKSLQTVYGENVLMMRVDDCLIFGNKNALRSLAEKLTESPSVEPERKPGRWVLWNGPWSEYVKCTACGEMYDQDDLYIGGNDYPEFCPNCGARMARGDHE